MHDPSAPQAQFPTHDWMRRQFDRICTARPDARPGELIELLRAALDLSRDGGARPAGEPAAELVDEIEALADTIAKTRTELAALRVEDINSEHIPSATDELDAVIDHTAEATDKILEVCEALDTVAGTLVRGGPEYVALQAATEKIYEACSFQDITGQRIGKVVAALKTIEAKVTRIIAAVHRTPGSMPAPEPVDPNAPVILLHGPQLPASALAQNDIDRLLSGVA